MAEPLVLGMALPLVRGVGASMLAMEKSAEIPGVAESFMRTSWGGCSG